MKIYTYFPSSGFVTKRASRHRDTIAVEHGSPARELIHESELDTATGRYFTTKRRAVEAFIAKGEARIGKLSRNDAIGWREALRDAHKILSILTKAHP